jgi:hypothetical protein
VTFRRASGNGRSASLALGTIDRSGFWLGISMPGASVIAWGCSFDFGSPRGLDVADDGLATGLDGNVFDPDCLLAFAAMMVQRIE